MPNLSKAQKSNYCPSCLNDTLSINQRGMIEIFINGKKMDAGHFLYNLSKDSEEEIFNTFRRKLKDFFSWYSSFQNKLPIKTVEIVSGDFSCDKKCQLPRYFRSTVVGLIIPKAEVEKALKELSERYHLEVDL